MEQVANTFKVTEIMPRAGMLNSDRKIKNFTRGIIAIDRDGKKICELRQYDTAKITMACFWVWSVTANCNGSGHCPSYAGMACFKAVRSAGVTMATFSDNDAEDAIGAIARALVGANFLTVVASAG